MNGNSYVYLWRSIMETAFYKKPLTCHLAIHLILSAAWKDHEQIIGGEKVLIQRGQIPTGRKRLAEETGLSPQNIRTCLQHLSTSGFLTIESTNVCSIITICKYNNFQPSDEYNQPTHQPTTNQPSTNHQPLQNKDIRTTILSSSKNSTPIPHKEIIEYLNANANTKYRHTTKPTQRLIKARFNEGFNKQDFFTVIDKKTADWKSDPKMVEYLRPQTLFGTKFESYLQKAKAEIKSKEYVA